MCKKVAVQAEEHELSNRTVLAFFRLRPSRFFPIRFYLQTHDDDNGDGVMATMMMMMMIRVVILLLSIYGT